MRKTFAIVLALTLTLSLAASTVGCRVEFAGGSETSPQPASGTSGAPAANLTLDQVKVNALAAGYGTDNGKSWVPNGPAEPVNGFEFKHPDLTGDVNVLEFASESDAKAYADYAAQKNGGSWRNYVRSKFVLEFSIWDKDTGFTADKESQLVAALFSPDSQNNNNTAAATSTPTVAPSPSDKAEPSAAASATASGGKAAPFVKLLSGDTYHIKTSGVTAGVDITVEAYMKNGMYAQYYTSSGMSTINIFRDGKLYTFYVDDKSYTVQDAPFDSTSAIYDTSDLTYDSSGTADFGGKNLPYDTYIDSFGDATQYFTDGNALIGIRTIDSFDNSNQDTNVLALDQNISDSAFELPGGYTLYTPEIPNLQPVAILTTSLTLAQVQKNAEDAKYTVFGNFDYEPLEGAPATPVSGFTFEHPDLFMKSFYVLEFQSENDAKAFADFMQKSSDAWGAYHEYVQGNLVLEIDKSQFDDLTADIEKQIVSALFK
ncbi:MAG: hypothetical protein FWC55_09650 [Firmicutes bacterium]|nr:hypothetical protein [Bacillota bacterium]